MGGLQVKKWWFSVLKYVIVEIPRNTLLFTELKNMHFPRNGRVTKMEGCYGYIGISYIKIRPILPFFGLFLYFFKLWCPKILSTKNELIEFLVLLQLSHLVTLIWCFCLGGMHLVSSLGMASPTEKWQCFCLGSGMGAESLPRNVSWDTKYRAPAHVGVLT